MPTNPHKESRISKADKKPKSAMDALIESFGEVIDSGAKEMSPAQLRDSEKRFNEIADRVAASRKRRRETA